MGRHRNYALGGTPTPEATEAMLARNFSLTPTQVKALAGTAVEVVPAPGANRCLIPIAFCWRLKFNTTAYAAGSNIDIGWASGPTGFGIIVAPQLDVQQAADNTEFVICNTGFPNGDTTLNMVNQALMLQADGADFTLGDSVIEGTTFYSVAFLP